MTGYYDLPMLKRPLWGWEIALYFFSEGVSSGCYLLATAAELANPRVHTRLIRNARCISLAALLPCPPLLIADLGRPERFLHMLRVFKPSSPMNLGAWALTAFSLPVGALALAEAFRLRWIPKRTLAIAGLPFAMIMLCYPGVLLSTTSNPLWASSRWVGALLASSSMASAAGALSLVSSSPAVQRIADAAHLAEALAAAAYVSSAGPAAKPLLKGRYATMFRAGAVVAGIAVPALISAARGRRGRGASIAGSILTLAGSLALKWAIVHAGRESADDPAANRDFTKRTG